MPLLRSRLTLISSISTLFIFCCSAGLALAVESAQVDGCKYHYSQGKTEVDGHVVTVENYIPEGRREFPLVFMLHGSAGAFSLRSNDEPAQDNFGEKKLAQSCFVVVLPHYLEALGLKSLTSERQMVSLFPALLASVESVLSEAESLQSTRNEPVFLFGESLGGYLCVALAFRRKEVAAVSEYGGGLPSGYLLSRAGVPRVLISHGKADDVVPFVAASTLYSYLRDHRVPAELDPYPDEGHYLSPGAQHRILLRTIDFFRLEKRAKM